MGKVLLNFIQKDEAFTYSKKEWAIDFRNFLQSRQKKMSVDMDYRLVEGDNITLMFDEKTEICLKVKKVNYKGKIRVGEDNYSDFVCIEDISCDVVIELDEGYHGCIV